MSSLADNLKSVWQSITNIPSLVWNSFKDSFSTLWDWLGDIFDSIVELPTTIINGFKDIFIPKTENISTMFSDALENIRGKFGFQEFHLDSLANNSSQPTDIEKTYSIHGIGAKNFKFFDTKYLIQGVNYFRPFIRGFMVLLLLFYNARQFLTFIGHEFGAVSYASAKSEKGD